MDLIQLATIGIGVSLLIMVLVLLRRFSAAAMLDVNTISAEKERRTKERLAAERFKRSSDEAVKTIQRAFSPLVKSVQGVFGDLFNDISNGAAPRKRAAIGRPFRSSKSQGSALRRGSCPASRALPERRRDARSARGRASTTRNPGRLPGRNGSRPDRRHARRRCRA